MRSTNDPSNKRTSIFRRGRKTKWSKHNAMTNLWCNVNSSINIGIISTNSHNKKGQLYLSISFRFFICPTALWHRSNRVHAAFDGDVQIIITTVPKIDAVAHVSNDTSLQVFADCCFLTCCNEEKCSFVSVKKRRHLRSRHRQVLRTGTLE